MNVADMKTKTKRVAFMIFFAYILMIGIIYLALMNAIKLDG